MFVSLTIFIIISIISKSTTQPDYSIGATTNLPHETSVNETHEAQGQNIHPLCSSCYDVNAKWKQLFISTGYKDDLFDNITSKYCSPLIPVNKGRICYLLIKKIYYEKYDSFIKILNDYNTFCARLCTGRMLAAVHVPKDETVISSHQSVRVSESCIDCTELVRNFCLSLDDDEAKQIVKDELAERYCTTFHFDSIFLDRACLNLIDYVYMPDAVNWLKTITRDSRVLCATIKECDSKATILHSTSTFIIAIISSVYIINTLLVFKFEM